MPPKVKKLSSRELQEEIKNNGPLARSSLQIHGMPKPIQSISAVDLLCTAIKYNREDIVRLMISKGCPVESEGYNRNGNSPVHAAVESKNLNIVRVILQAANARRNVIVNKVKNSETPLHIAIKNLQKDMILLLMQYGADWKSCTNGRETILHLTLKNVKTTDSYENIKGVLEIFLNQNMNIDCQTSDGQTLLHFAVKAQIKELVEFFLTHNANLHALDKQGNSALHLLVNHELSYGYRYTNRYGINRADTDEEKRKDKKKADFIEWLISIGADIELQNLKGETPLYLAIKSKQKEVISTLLNHTENFDSTDLEEKNNILHSLLESYQNDSLAITEFFGTILEKEDETVKQKVSNAINSLNKKGDTPVHLALRYKHDKLVLALLLYFKDINISGANRQSLLHIALGNCLSKNNSCTDTDIKIIKNLISKGANVDEKNKSNEIPLQLASKFKNKEIITLLLDSGADASVKSADGKNLLHFLGLESMEVDNTIQKEMVDLFIDKGCDLNEKTDNGKTPLCIAIQSRSVGVVERLFELYTQTNTINKEALCHVLATVAENNCEGLIETLLKHGADANYKFPGGKTALHIAAKHKDNKIIKTLLANSADYEIRDDTGKIPLHYACWYESPESIDHLLEYGADINTKDQFSKVPKDYVSGIDEDLVKKFLYYVTKLEVADLFIAKKNKELIEKNKNNDELNTFAASCLGEVEKLKDFIVYNNVSVYDVLHMNKNRLSMYKIKSSLNKILCSVNLKEKFPIYRDLILASHRKGVLRYNLLNSALKSLVEIAQTNLPDNCLENILKYYTNEELRHLIDQELILTKKRKISKIDETSRTSEPSPKKQRTE